MTVVGTESHLVSAHIVGSAPLVYIAILTMKDKLLCQTTGIIAFGSFHPLGSFSTQLVLKAVDLFSLYIHEALQFIPTLAKHLLQTLTIIEFTF